MPHASRARTAPGLCGLSAPSAKPHSAFGPRSGSMSRGTSACVGPGRVGPGGVAGAVSGGVALSHAAFGRVVSPARPLRPAVPRRARWWHAEPRDQLVSLQAWGPRRRSEESGVGIELRDRPKSCRRCPVACSTGAGESFLPLRDADDDQPCSQTHCWRLSSRLRRGCHSAALSLERGRADLSGHGGGQVLGQMLRWEANRVSPWPMPSPSLPATSS
jgi:hypothetical protein